MAKYQVEDIRNIALCGHGSAGKTTLVDTILNKTGTVNRQGSVDDKTSICDFDEEEKVHGYSIEATVTHFEHGGKRFNMIDTPGYPDFLGQTVGALYGVDTAAIVVNAASGIEVNTRRVFNEAKNIGLGRMVVINKLDSENLDFQALLDSIQEVFGVECVPLNVPIGLGSDFSGVASTLNPPSDTSGAVIDPGEINESLIESIVMADEEMMEAYLEGNMPSDEQLSKLLVQAVADGGLIPVVCVSGKTGAGLTELLDAMAMCALPPTVPKRTAKKNQDDEEVEVKADPDGPLVAQVFKTRIDPFVQKLSFLRIFSGTLKKDSNVPATGVRKGLKIAQLFEVQANETEPVDEATAGSIVAVVKMEDLHTGMSLGELTMPALKFPTPMVGQAVTPKSRNDQTKLSGGLQKLVEEDPTFRRELDPQTKETVITGMSELHLQIVQERLKRRDKVEVDTKPPKIPYRETIQTNAEGHYRHKKQSGGSGQFAEVHIRMFPFPRGTDVEEFATKERFPSMKEAHYDEENNFLWIDSVVGGSIPGNFMPAVEKGFRERLERGVIAGYRVQNVCVEVHFGKDHPVDSNEQAFKTASSMVFRNVFQEAKPCLLEPIVNIEITVPSENVGDINSDISTRRGRPHGMTSAGGGMQTVSAEVPLAEVMTYNRTLASVTGGQGSYTLEFSHYDVVPPNVQQEIIKSAKLEEEED